MTGTSSLQIEELFIQLAQNNDDLCRAFCDSSREVTRTEQGIEFTLPALYQFYSLSLQNQKQPSLSQQEFFQALYNSRTQEQLKKLGSSIEVTQNTGKIIHNRYLLCL